MGGNKQNFSLRKQSGFVSCNFKQLLICAGLCCKQLLNDWIDRAASWRRHPLNQRHWTFWRAALFSGHGARSQRWMCESACLLLLCEASVCLSVNCWLRLQHLLPAKYGCYPRKTAGVCAAHFGPTLAALKPAAISLSPSSAESCTSQEVRVSDGHTKDGFRCKIWIILVL